MGVPHSPTPPDAKGAGTRGCLPLRITGLACALTLTLAFVGPALATSGKPGGKDATAASAGEVAERQGDLKSLRAQIETLRRDMAAAEGSRKDVADQLQDAERAISSTQRELHSLTTQIGKLQAALRNLDAESRELEKGLRAQQGQLEKLLYRQYLRGNPDPLRLLLNGEDPNQSARDLRYLEAIGRTRRQLLIDIESTLQRKQALAGETRQQAEQLSAAELRQQEEHARLLAQREQRQTMLNKVADQILTQRREIGNLQRDEKRLTELIDRLARIIAARASRRASQRNSRNRAPGKRTPGRAAPGNGETRRCARKSCHGPPPRHPRRTRRQRLGQPPKVVVSQRRR
jgi:septal ring factor EnvC (AmiA/AmiB activator)